MSRYLVLAETIPREEIPKLMGRVVLDSTDPLKRYIPDESSGFSVEDIVPNLCLPITTYTNRDDLTKLASTKSLSARLTQYFSADASQSTSENLRIHSKEVKRYRMANHSLKYDLLTDDKRFSSAVDELFKRSKAKEAYWIVAFLTAKMSRWSVHTGQSINISVRARIPVGEATGTSSTLDPEFGAAFSRTSQQVTKTMINGEEVFAVAYEVLRREGWRERTRKVVLNEEKRVPGIHLSLTDADGTSDDEIDGEQAVTDAMQDTDGDMVLYE